MAKKMIVGILCVIVLTACVDGKKECLVCGEFNLVNLTKNDFNSEENNPVSIRRTLNIDAFSGHDYYTIWSWSETEPEASWSEQMEKEVLLQKNRLKINPNRTWEWSIETEEKYNSSSFFGNEFIEAETNHAEFGVWEYVNKNENFVRLTRKGVSNSISETNLLSNNPISDSISVSKSFQVTRDLDRGTVTLKSIQTQDSNYSEIQNPMTYSILEGEIFLTLKERSAQRIVARIK